MSTRRATPADIAQLHDLICALAVYEKEPDAVVATPADLHDALFVGSQTLSAAPAAYALVIDDPEHPNQLAAMALYFINYSTWLGRHGIYLEDLFVRPECRGRGYGQALLAELAAICVQQGYGRLEWSVLDWNTPAWDFYESRGATAMSEWTVHRLSGPDLIALAQQARTQACPTLGEAHDG